MLKKFIFISFIFQYTLYAITIGTAKKMPNMDIVVNYLAYYKADKLTNNAKQVQVNNLGLDLVQNLIRPVFYRDNVVYFANIPLMSSQVSLFNYNEKGLGDISLSVGKFLDIDSIDIGPVISVTLPTGKYDKNSPVNLGNNIYSISPQLYINYDINERFMIDSSTKYFFKFKNQDTNVKNGDEFRFEAVLSYRQTKYLKYGPSIIYRKTDVNKLGGNRLANSDTMIFKAGFDLSYPLSKKVFSVINYMKDISAKNTTKGESFLLQLGFIF